MSINELNQIYTSFQTQFPIEKLKSLTLEEYTNLDRDNSFCYWLGNWSIYRANCSSDFSPKRV